MSALYLLPIEITANRAQQRAVCLAWPISGLGRESRMNDTMTRFGRSANCSNPPK